MNTLMKRSNGNVDLPATPFSSMVDRIFQDNLSRFFDDNFWGFSGPSRNTNVPVNVRETDKSYELEFVAPGLKKDDFKVNLNGETLTVSFEQQQQNDQGSKEEGWLRNEYRMSSFSRSFRLDDSIDPAQITARYKDGVLYLQLLKKETAQKAFRAIEVS
jgi:HSP20 family protein